MMTILMTQRKLNLFKDFSFISQFYTVGAIHESPYLHLENIVI